MHASQLPSEFISALYHRPERLYSLYCIWLAVGSGEFDTPVQRSTLKGRVLGFGLASPGSGCHQTARIYAALYQCRLYKRLSAPRVFDCNRVSQSSWYAQRYSESRWGCS